MVTKPEVNRGDVLLFRILLKRWRDEGLDSYDLHERRAHCIYQRLVDMKWVGVVLVLQELSRGKLYQMFSILEEITGAQPVPNVYSMSLSEKASRWIGWGIQNKIFPRY